jgi:predicted dehydrogenase
MKASVLVIGAGNIAQAYDSIQGPEVRTHIKGYQYYGDCFSIKTLFDIDAEKARDVANRWSIPQYCSDFSTIKHLYYDVISICSPDKTHEFYLDEALKMKPKVIFIEKPLNITTEKAKEVYKYCLASKILLLVNYSRVYIPEFIQIKEREERNDFGKILSIGLKYHGGFLHNCSHLINLIAFLFNPAIRHTFITNSITDYSSDDPSLSAIVYCKKPDNKFTLTIEAYDSSIVNMTEVDLITEKIRIRYVESKGSLISEAGKFSYKDGIDLQEFVSVNEYRVDYNYAMKNAILLIMTFLEKPTEKLINEQFNLQIKTLELLQSIKSGINI